MNKIDRLVAERVMCWTVNKERYPYVWDVPLRQNFLFEAWGSTAVEHAPNFSSDISDAWEVREEMLRAEYSFGIDDHRGPFGCTFYHDGRTWTGDHEKPEMAICLAALRAVGVPESEIQEAMR